jgi:peptide/nickel transport system substrate-binding protein
VKLMSFRKGDADVIINAPPQEVGNLEKEGFRVVRWAQYLSAPWGAIADSANPSSAWSKLGVRQAAQHAIDCPALVKGLLFGESEAPTQMASKADWAYNPDVVGYPFNPTKAKQLLADAGYATGFKTKYTYQAQNAANQSMAEAMARYLGDVGITVELNPVPSAKLQEYEFAGTPWDGLVFNGPPPYGDVAAGMRERYWGDGKNFCQMIAPDDYKQAIDKAVTAPDFDTKQKWTREAGKLMTDKYALMLMCYFFLGLSAEQTNVHDTGIGKVPSLNWTPADTWISKK